MLNGQAATRYRWADLPQDHPAASLARRRIIGQRMMLSEVLLEKGCVVPSHAHDNEQFVCVLRGKIRFGIGAEGSPDRHEMVVEGGEVLHLPSDVPHSAVALEESLVIDMFSPPSEKTGIDQG
ncbi:MAG: cupin domain-containing protein [Planctomycetota bacterium]|jgi:quercetin dioxygenase-like cupin family protein